MSRLENSVGGARELKMYKACSPTRSVADIWENLYSGNSSDLPAEFSHKHMMYARALEELGFFENLTDSSLIVQAGVGHGKTLRTVMESVINCNTIGLDISFSSLQRNKGTNGTSIKGLVQGDILQIPFADGSVDRVFEVGVVEHLYNTDDYDKQTVDRVAIVDSFRELHRVLKPHGQVGFIQPSKHSFQPLSKRLDQLQNKWNMGYQEDFAISEFGQLLQIAGFHNIRYNALQAPPDFPLELRVADRLLKTWNTATGDYRRAELVGALFTMVADKKE